jgi:hypothetical protein
MQTQARNGTQPMAGAFVNLRKAAVSFVMPVRLTIRSNSAPNGQIFAKLCIFRKSAEKISFIKT